MSTRWYPIYKKGNPQLRVFLPNFWMKLVKPAFGQPKNIVQFIVSMEMTNYDIKNYLEKIYKVPVCQVRSEIVEGELYQDQMKGYVKKRDDFRRALVTLKNGEVFEFPDIHAKRIEKEGSEQKKFQEGVEETYKNFENKNKNRKGLPNWFNMYPIYKKGNPQLRVFLPNFWMKLVKPAFGQPKNIVQFIVSMEMTNYDIKNYLEKIYKVPVCQVRSEIVEGELYQDQMKGYVKKRDDFRRALVTLKNGEVFEFPDIHAKRIEKEGSEQKKFQEGVEETYKNFENKNKNRKGLPNWFNM